MENINTAVSRRSTLRLAAAGAVSTLLPYRVAIGARTKVRVGLLLPKSGTYAQLGQAITNGIALKFAEMGERLGGREIEVIAVDSEAKAAKATENTTKLINQEKVDFLVGPVHSGVAMAMVKIAREEGAITIVPNAGADQVTGPLCAPNIFRTSFSNWQPGHPLGKILMDEGKKNVVVCYWDYAAGKQMVQGFKDGFLPLGGQIIKEIAVTFPQVEFQAALTEIASLKPDAVYVFYAGGGAIKFVKDWHAAGLTGIELVGPGFLTEGVLDAEGEAAEGLRTTLHYADSLDLPANKTFRAAYKAKFGIEADVYAVQGYDAGELIRAGMEAVQGDTGARDELLTAISGAEFASPRGPFKLSAAHNPIQNIYLRQVQGGENIVVNVAEAALSDPAKGCRLN
ncbi:MAG: ABC transporter substrate-binding protein [Hyphomicrobiales bacterium]|nr:ABC transporter substrate-binding protein [Hyphomicrobiales bacterium]